MNRPVRALSVTVAFFVVLGFTTGVVREATASAGGVSVLSQSAVVAGSAPLAFDGSLSNALMTLEGSGQSVSASAQAFYDSYVGASGEYTVALRAAADVYRDSYAGDPISAKSVYLDNVSHARTAYLTALDTARDELVSELVGQNAVRDQFSDGYAAARTAYVAQFDATYAAVAGMDAS